MNNLEKKILEIQSNFKNKRVADDEMLEYKSFEVEFEINCSTCNKILKSKLQKCIRCKGEISFLVSKYDYHTHCHSCSKDIVNMPIICDNCKTINNWHNSKNVQNQYNKSYRDFIYNQLTNSISTFVLSIIILTFVIIAIIFMKGLF